MAFLIGNVQPSIQRLAVPAVCLLIAFESYTPQWLFANAPDLAPGPLTPTEKYVFNGLVLCLWYTYYRACTVNPGRYVFPPSIKKKHKEKAIGSDAEETAEEIGRGIGAGAGRTQIRRWCKKCSAPKPPRSHHCRTCRRCVPRMDHHCPWTSNCVSLQTFPHFLRFLVFTNLSLWTLLYFLSQRFLGLYESRHLPSYLGPTLAQLSWLTILTFASGMTSLALGILLITTLKGWVFNTTMIESWEIERHEATLERKYASSGGEGSWWAAGERAPGGDYDAPHLTADPIEFPYDIGIFANMATAMGTRNPLLWFFPFAGGPTVSPYPYSETTDPQPSSGSNSNNARTGWEYEENGLNDREGLWPPADPDKIRNAKVWRERKREADRALEEDRIYGARDPEVDREAFRRRQERDLRRWETSRSRILGELEELPVDGYDEYDFVDEAYDRDHVQRPGPGAAVVVDEGKSGWVNADGEHLGDYGVDSDAELDEPVIERDPQTQGVGRYTDEEEDIPLAELIRRSKVVRRR
ncbi:zf-DHHC-domain-containing protein [Annulohypoxylon maeteangense]|uniref:zf-DHHC-domain-containing protein n=1 Tax=Annulohypoxylon maeteangense TaxID=1927788 RepID=UPI0020088398|nr:zf-DHHC-domain-containing protein [Annulohypoxylon maeteangense]KAI0882310.1 zf-DHHC-domain-containing protein [Annulohypoxylon maeteangense]